MRRLAEAIAGGANPGLHHQKRQALRRAGGGPQHIRRQPQMLELIKRAGATGGKPSRQP